MIRIAPDVAWVEDEDLPEAGRSPDAAPVAAVYVARLPDGVPLVLEGSAWAVWRAIANGADSLEAVADAAASLLAVPADEAVRADVSRFVDQLVSAGLVAT